VLDDDVEWKKRVNAAWDARSKFKKHEEKTLRPMRERMERLARMKALKTMSTDDAERQSVGQTGAKGFLNLSSSRARGAGYIGAKIKNVMSGYGAKRERFTAEQASKASGPPNGPAESSSESESRAQRAEQYVVAAETLVLSAYMASLFSSFGAGFYVKRLGFVLIALSILIAWRAAASRASKCSFPLDGAWESFGSAVLGISRRVLGLHDNADVSKQISGTGSDPAEAAWCSDSAYARACFFYWLCIGWHRSQLLFGNSPSGLPLRTVVASMLSTAIFCARPVSARALRRWLN
jgi:hypothetical protein